MDAPRSSLWADVVLNLAVLTVLAITLNAVLLGQVLQGREADLRASAASELSQSLAVRAGTFTDLERGAESFRAASIPQGEPWFAVLVTPSLKAVSTLGDWPADVVEQASQTAWLVEAVDLRAAITGQRTERGQWQPKASFFGRSWAVASSPVVAPGGRVIGAVRVAVPVGSALAGPADRRTLPVLALSALLSALSMGAFGYFLFRRRILVPVSTLLQSTRGIASGDFRIRLPEEAANELGELAAAFNDMAARLETYRGANEQQVAELRAINADLGQAREDLIFAEKMATVGRLAAGVAHEVGNPLASVIGFVELLEADSDPTLAADLLPRVRKELDRINQIIRDLLNYARPTGQTYEELEAVEPLHTVQVADVVENAATLVTAQKRFADVRFEIDLPSELPGVDVHPGRLQQVVLNLFVNAAEAMDGNGAIHVVIAADAEATRRGQLTLEVRDDGPGVDPRAGSNIFEPFFTTKEVGAGTGLGLAVSLRLVERMGGTLKNIRDAEGGACFWLSLPIEGSRA
jgi:two-component system, NtrC family, sensor kinase